MNRLLGFSFLILAFCFCGCAHYSAFVRPGSKIANIKTVFVENNLSDNHRIEEMILNSLKARGIQAESGPPTMMPDEVDAVLRYNDAWTWDFSDHLIGLQIEMLDGNRQKPIGMAQYSGAAALTTTAPEVVDRLIKELFSDKAKATR